MTSLILAKTTLDIQLEAEPIPVRKQLLDTHLRDPSLKLLLTTKPLAEQLPLLKEGPKDGFRSNRLAAQFFTAFREFFVIERM